MAQVVQSSYTSDLFNAVLSADNVCAGAVLPITDALYWLSSSGDPSGGFCGLQIVGDQARHGWWQT